jgi:hypothetical protein
MAEPVLVLSRRNERANHPAVVVRTTSIQHTNPEVVAIQIKVAAQVGEVLSQYKRLVVLRLFEFRVIVQGTHYRSTTDYRIGAALIVSTDQIRAFAAQIDSRGLHAFISASKKLSAVSAFWYRVTNSSRCTNFCAKVVFSLSSAAPPATCVRSSEYSLNAGRFLPTNSRIVRRRQYHRENNELVEFSILHKDIRNTRDRSG